MNIIESHRLGLIEQLESEAVALSARLSDRFPSAATGVYRLLCEIRPA